MTIFLSFKCFIEDDENNDSRAVVNSVEEFTNKISVMVLWLSLSVIKLRLQIVL